ncbi:MAG: hypothetical protein ABSG78_14650 [Verrucomicrobiota bacterium]|jgi:dolichyl-phosphate-mannose--protein O-mannosyl transferase
MKTWLAILLTLGLASGCALIYHLIEINLFMILIVSTSVWVGIDSWQVHLARYQSGISYQPITLGILCSLFWIVAFPWYLSMRQKIRSGRARLRSEFEPFRMSDGQIGPNGLVQPWKGRKL